MKHPGGGPSAMHTSIPADTPDPMDQALVLDALGDAVFVLDENMRVLLVNEAFRQWRSRIELPREVEGLGLLEVFPLLPREIFAGYQKVYANGEAVTTDIVTTLEGKKIIHECRITPVRHGDSIIRSVTVMRDVTEQRRVDRERMAAQERYQVVVEHANEAIFVTQNEKVIFINPRALEMAGYDRKTLTGKPFIEFVHPDDRAMVYETYQKRLQGEEVPGQYVFRFIHGDGHTMYMELHAALVTWDGKPAALNFLLDVTERLQHQEQLSYMARHDPLTGAFNRHCLDELLDIETRRSKRYTGTIGFLMMDINYFKTINDTHGHQTGDKVLREVATLLNSQVRDVDYVVRYGGDEFLLIMPQTATETELVKRRIEETMKQWNDKDSPFEFPVNLSIGSAHWAPEAGEKVEAVLARADERMYEHKAAGRKAKT